MTTIPAHTITSIDALTALFPEPGEASLLKERDHVDANYRAMIAASPFCTLATVGPDGMDCSPRGDPAGFVDVVDPHTLILPERRGNNRIDTLRNLLTNPHIGLLFLIPGISETLRVNGRAAISVDPTLLARYALHGQQPKVVLIVSVDSVYFQCSRAIVRADLWNPEKYLTRTQVPTPGQILSAASTVRKDSQIDAPAFDGVSYDNALAERVKNTLY